MREVFSGDLRPGLVSSFEELEDVSADGAFEAALGVSRGLPLADSSGDVSTGDGVEADTDQGNRVECSVELPVAAEVDPVPVGQP